MMIMIVMTVIMYDDAGTGVTHTLTVPGVMTRVRSCVDQSPAKVSLNVRRTMCY